MREFELALAASARPWADRLHRHTIDHGGARVRVRVLDATAAIEEAYDVLIVDDTCSFLDARLVDDLRSAGKGVVGVADGPQMDEAREWLARMGVHVVLPAAANPAAFLEAAAQSRPLRRTASAAPSPPELSDGPSHLLLAVMGSSGGVGATEVAIAAALAWPRQVVLADLDLSSPSVAQRLGMSLLPNLRSALHARRKVVELLEAELQGLTADVRVLPGLPASVGERPHAQEVVGLVRDLRSLGDLIVNLPAGMPDRTAPHNAPAKAAAEVLAEADLATVVTVATPVGIRRLFEWASQAASIGIEHPSVVINQAPRSAYARSEIEREVERVLEPASVTFLPGDPRVTKAAWNGTVISRGPFLRALRPAVRGWAAS
jgi:MinD-like ATPase involved in chromosome partitioning or flagellar assembly